MRLINGFVTKAAFTDNQPDQISTFFELSPKALTYSRDRGEYQLSNHAGTTLHTFSTIETATGEYFVLSQGEVLAALDVTAAVVSYMGGLVGTVDRLHFRQFMRAGLINTITDFDFGTIVVGANGRFPDWISYKQLGGATEARLWLSDSAFLSQYSDYSVEVTPPLDNVNDFFRAYSEVTALLSTLTFSDIVSRAQDTQGVFPATATRLLTFKFVNKNNPTQSVDTHWCFSIYGQAGDNVDAMKDALVAFLLANSTHTEEEWRVLLPDVFKRTEFVLYPRWDKVSIANTNTAASLYSSIFSPTEMLNFLTRNEIMDYTDSFVVDRAEVIPFDYKAITCAAVPGETNGTEATSLSQLFTDYLPLSTSELDFNRMTPRTRNWVVKMVEMMIVAETATEYTAVQSPFRKVKRNDKLFVTFLYEGINYLVSARSNNFV